jgi:hypothetical protein
MLKDLVFDKQLIIFFPLLGDDVLVVLQKLEVALLSSFEVAEEDCPVVVEVRLQARSILEVHSNKYIINQNRPKIITLYKDKKVFPFN